MSSAGSEDRPSDATLREVIETLAPIERPPCSEGERRAAEWLIERFERAGAPRVELEEETGYGTFPPTLLAAGGVALAGVGLALRGLRAPAFLVAVASLAVFADEVENGPRVFRRAVRRPRPLVNVVARFGPEDAERTLVVLAHHDAAQTGAVFDQGLQRKAFELAPAFMDRFRTSIPQWWLALVTPGGAAAAALSGRRGPARLGLAVGLLGMAVMADIQRSPTVQGANDNLSGVAGLVGLAELLAQRTPPGLRVLLVSCGAEESLQDGIRGFVARHAGELPRERTWFLNFDTVGSPTLAMLEGEGPFAMRDYTDPEFRDLIAREAASAGVELERDMRARSSTDSVIPSRAGYPTATITSITAWRALANYHWPSDVPENVDYASVAGAVRLAYAVAEALSASTSDPAS